jgi:hypothetical protein
MTNRHLLRTLTILIMTVSFTPLPGCVEEPNPTMGSNFVSRNCTKTEGSALSGMSCQLGISVTAVSPTLQSELRSMLTTYVYALQSDDVAAIDKLISTELRARIEMRGPGADFASNLQTFVLRERHKLMRSIETSDAFRKPVAIPFSEMLADGSIVAIGLAIDGKAFAKPFYFVLDNGSYKLNVTPPDIAIASSSSTYRVQNNDVVARSFLCSGQSSTSSVPALGQALATCLDSCSGFFDGTTFVVNGKAVNCDFNTFGVDMFIENNAPRCHDPC